MFEITLTSEYPEQTAQFTISNQTYTASIKWNERFSFWSLSIYDRDSALIVGGVRMVANTSLIKHLNIFYFDGDFLFIRNSGDKSEPDFYSVGNDFSLIYISRSEINELVSA